MHLLGAALVGMCLQHVLALLGHAALASSYHTLVQLCLTAGSLALAGVIWSFADNYMSKRTADSGASTAGMAKLAMMGSEQQQARPDSNASVASVASGLSIGLTSSYKAHKAANSLASTVSSGDACGFALLNLVCFVVHLVVHLDAAMQPRAEC